MIGSSFLSSFWNLGLVSFSVRTGIAVLGEWPLTLMEKSVSERCGGGSYREKKSKVFSAVGAAATATSGASYVDSCVFLTEGIFGAARLCGCFKNGPHVFLCILLQFLREIVHKRLCT